MRSTYFVLALALGLSSVSRAERPFENQPYSDFSAFQQLPQQPPPMMPLLPSEIPPMPLPPAWHAPWPPPMVLGSASVARHPAALPIAPGPNQELLNLVKLDSRNLLSQTIREEARRLELAAA